MPWYGWLGWILMLTLGIGFLIYFLVRKRQPKSVSDIKLKLSDMENQLKEAKDQVVTLTLEKKKAEKAKYDLEIKFLNEEKKKKTKDLEQKEKEDYEKAKSDTQSGVDDMRKLLDLDDPSSTSKFSP